MNLSPTLQQAIEEIASSQGITPEQFITQTLLEKIKSLQSQKSTTSTSQTGLREQDGILVFETESLDHIDFNALLKVVKNVIRSNLIRESFI
jgi:predicted transcriptional regulator